MKVMWISTCHITPVSVKPARLEPRLPASMKVRSSAIEEMPMMAMASLIFSTLALTWPSHSGSSGWPLKVEPRDECLVAADDDHHEQVGDHHDVDQRQHAHHDLLLGEVEGVPGQMPELLEEQRDVDALRHDQSEIERQLQPARAEDDHRQQAEARQRRAGFGGFGLGSRLNRHSNGILASR